MYGFIYVTTNKITGEKYIGMCKYSHENNYLGSGRLLKKAIAKYGKENFFREIIENCNTFEDLCKAEKKWIEYHDAVNSKKFYNLYYGGFGGCSESMKNYWSKFTKEERKNVRKWNRVMLKNPMQGRKHSEETKKKIGSKSVNRNWGRKTPIYGEKNPKAIKIKILFEDGKEEYYGCIKDFCKKYNYNYSTMKSCIKSNRTKTKYGVEVIYV